MAERVGEGIGRIAVSEHTSVGILGGTGALGRGLAGRLAPVVRTVMIGSRDLGRARDTASALDDNVDGVSNAEACEADFVIVAVPWAAHDDLLVEVCDELRGRVVIDAVNPLAFDKAGAFALPVDDGSATQRAQRMVPRGRVVGAFHHVAASALSSGEPLDMDVLVVGDDRGAVDAVLALVDLVSGLRGVDAGGLRNAGQVEAITANLIAINRRYRTHSGLRVTGL